MSSDEMHSTMQFILEQQAQFAANIQKLQEGHLRADERRAKLEESMERLEASIARLEDSVERTVGLVTAIAHAQAQTEVNLARTDERLNSLIAVFERYLHEGRNGTS